MPGRWLHIAVIQREWTWEPLSERSEVVTNEAGPPTEEEHFTPTGTVFILALFVATIILLWGSVYVILLSRGVTS